MSRILVVEDDEQVRKMLKQVLEKTGYEVYTAENGKTALDIFSQSKADLVVTDIIMPEKEGLEMILDFRKDYPGVPIIAVSGGGRHIGAQDCLYSARKFGADRIFSKPFDIAALLSSIKGLLDEGRQA